MIEDFRRRLARWRATPAAWIWPLAVVTVLAAAAIGFRWWRALPGTPASVTYSTFLTRLDQGAVRSITVIPGSEVRGIWSQAVDDAPTGAALGWTIRPSR
ncbi:MAG TPA: ATP-dependent metallopeptidase FtsH/Yme1/Tma family protein [Gemmatimonadales bacterium]|nr:ATP-dependent metallopeptidase FtsH/Yme1/Tma family protein [Gemmatimonadales bacterium]